MDTIISGKTISYKIIDTLGEGAYGITYKAVGTDFKFYAVKKYLNSSGAIKEKTFEQSILENTTQICKDHAVCFIESILQNGIAYIVMDYLDGQDLNKIFKRTTLEQRRSKASRLISDIVIGLGKIRSIGIFHQDIKLENLMMEESGKVKYIDFGLSCIASNPATIGEKGYAYGVFFDSNEKCGSPGTITTAPPEMVKYFQAFPLSQDKKEFLYDFGLYPMNVVMAHDIWSIGCVILNWVSDIRDHPYKYIYSGTFNVFPEECVQMFESIREFDPVIENVIHGLLHRDPVTRNQNFLTIHAYYTSIFPSTLPEFEKTWNQYSITAIQKLKITEFRCYAATLAEQHNLPQDTQLSRIGENVQTCASYAK